MRKSKTISRDRLVAYLDAYLGIDTIPDDSANGMQVQGAARISKLAFAVDASATSIRLAVRAGADMLIVHHGLFWGKHQQIAGNLYKRIAALVTNDLALYAAHLPLDCHKEVGNNAELVRLLGLETIEPFAEYHGTEIGILARPQKPLRREELKNIIEKTLGRPADMLPFGPATIRQVGVISGGAAEFAELASRAGCDVLVTGESSHTAYHAARDAGINLVYGGHYATETVGLKALQRHLLEKFGVPGKFLSVPTGY